MLLNYTNKSIGEGKLPPTRSFQLQQSPPSATQLAMGVITVEFNIIAPAIQQLLVFISCCCLAHEKQKGALKRRHCWL